LAEVATPRSLPLLQQCLAVPEARVEVARNVARLSDSSVLGRWTRDEPDPVLRREILSALLDRDDAASVRVFLDRVEDPRTSAEALDCLALVPDPPVEMLFQFLRGPLAGQRMTAAVVLGRLDQPAVSRELIAMIHRGMYRHEAVIGLMASSEPTAQQFVAAALRDPVFVATLWNAKRQFQSLFPFLGGLNDAKSWQSG
jgi:hypothetical protein